MSHFCSSGKALRMLGFVRVLGLACVLGPNGMLWPTLALAQAQGGFFDNAWDRPAIGGAPTNGAERVPDSHPVEPPVAPPPPPPPPPTPEVPANANATGGSASRAALEAVRRVIDNQAKEESAKTASASVPAQSDPREEHSTNAMSQPAVRSSESEAEEAVVNSYTGLGGRYGGRTPQTSRVGKGALPKSEEYWQYLNWYKDHAIVSLVVSGTDREHLVDALATLYVLRERKVLIGRILVVGGDLVGEIENGGEAVPERSKPGMLSVRPTSLSVMGKKLGLHGGAADDPRQVISRLNVTRSPTWVVRYHGVDLVYEGGVDARTLFTGDGRFRGDTGEPGQLTKPATQLIALDDPEVPVVKKSSRSGPAFDMSHPASNDPAAAEFLRKYGAEAQAALTSVAVRYDMFVSELPVGAGTHDVPPICTESRVRHKSVLVDTEDLQWFDIVFYSYADSHQAAQADAWERPAAPYLEGDLYNPYRSNGVQQDFGRLFGVECLPTRFYFTMDKGQRVLEYREGERAWDRLPSGQ